MSFLRNGLVSYYAFDENTGTSVGDSIGGNTGTWNGTLGSQWTTGIINSGGLFNGTDNYVDCGTYSLGNIWSLQAWVYCTSTSSSAQTILSKRDSFSSSTMMWHLYVNPNTLNIRMITNAGIASNDMGTLSLNTWTHVIYTHAGIAANQNLLYLNGALQNNSGVTMNNGTGTTAHVEIGADTAGTAEFFIGKIDEVGLWSRVLSAAETASLYNSGSGVSFSSFSPPSVTGTSGIQSKQNLQNLSRL